MRIMRHHENKWNWETTVPHQQVEIRTELFRLKNAMEESVLNERLKKNICLTEDAGLTGNVMQH